MDIHVSWCTCARVLLENIPRSETVRCCASSDLPNKCPVLFSKRWFQFIHPRLAIIWEFISLTYISLMTNKLNTFSYAYYIFGSPLLLSSYLGFLSIVLLSILLICRSCHRFCILLVL